MKSSIFKIILIIFIFSLELGSFRQENELNQIIKRIKEKYAPDTRIAVFNISYKITGNKLILIGETDNLKAKQELISQIKLKTKRESIIDSISILPDSSLINYSSGIAIHDVNNLHSGPSEKAELVTQALMGTVVRLLKKKLNYYYVQMPDGYLGWINSNNILICDKYKFSKWNTTPKLIITSLNSVIRTKPSEHSDSVCTAIMGCILQKSDSIYNDWIKVELPDGRIGFLHDSTVMNLNEWKTSRMLTANNIEKTAKLFLGVPYLWGGTSIKGFDCSGFVKTVYFLNGKDIPRDSDQQARLGKKIKCGKNFKNLKKGDLLFFKKNNGEKIGHVAIYIGNWIFIHCDKYVRFGSFDPKSEYFDKNLAKRFLFAKRLF